MMEPFVRKQEVSGVDVYRISEWEGRYPQLSVGFSTRLGGVSEEGCQSLNCALHVADDPQHVIENRRRLATAAGFSLEAWTCGEQVHDHRVAVVSKHDRGRGRLDRSSAIPDTDALISQADDVMLVSFYADCVPLYFYDPAHEAVGLAHAGWKGTAQHIAARTVEAMVDAFASDPEQILTVIGPAIGSCCYEVDDRVIHAMQMAGIDEGWHANDNHKYMLDLKGVNKQILRKAGILATNIEITNLCTSCHVETFFSHRRDGGKTGRMASWIGIKR